MESAPAQDRKSDGRPDGWLWWRRIWSRRTWWWRRGGGGCASPTPTAKASAELRTLLENKDASADDIKAKLAALREARAKTRADLEAARKELKEVLTQRQEAVLVTNGMLE